jgi:uncharacterized protein (TIGR00290 family)
MHGVREELLDRQASALGISQEKVLIPYPCPNAIYEKKMHDVLSHWKDRGITHAIFGDLFLEDIRRYREENLAKLNIIPVFPVWGRDTASLAKEMLEVGFKAVITCVDPKKLAATFAGRQFDASLLKELPAAVDPCGENGEFHTFVYDGPVFREPIPVGTGQTVERDGFIFTDLLLRR